MSDGVGKKLLNAPSSAVIDSLRGLCYLNPAVSLIEEHKVVYRTDLSDQTVRDAQVHLISGGGSGHEPAHAAYVGAGMLSAAVCGDVFASPSSRAVLAAIKQCAGKKGVLLIVKNYTGDRLQFSLALSQARAQRIQVDMVVVGEDAAISSARKEFAGRRGLAGTALVHKIVGAWARKGAPLPALAQLASHLSTQLITLSLALSPISLPGAAPSFSIPADSFELGLGIHGEPGAATVPATTCKEAISKIIDGLVGEESTGREYLPIAGGDHTILLVNNLGGLSGLEMGVVVKEAVEAMRARNLSPTRLLSGPLMTSLDMRGISLTLLRLPGGAEPAPIDESLLSGFAFTEKTILEALEEPVAAPGWPGGGAAVVGSPVDPKAVAAGGEALPAELKTRSAVEGKDAYKDAPSLRAIILAACQALIAAESELDGLDGVAGDGDTGRTLAGGARAVEAADAAGSLDYADPARCLAEVQDVLAGNMGGTMGALIGVWIGSVAEFLRDGGDRASAEGDGRWESLKPRTWAEAVQIATKATQKVSGAKYGGRTLFDSLSPFSSTLVFSGDVGVAARSAKMGAKSTADIEVASHGRSSYVGRSLKGHMDPGAVAIWRVTEAVAELVDRWQEEKRQTVFGRR